MSRLGRAALVAVPLAVACGRAQPTVPPVDLRPTADTISTPYAEIPEAAWLSDDRWLAVAPGEGVLLLADFRAGARRAIELPRKAGSAETYRQPYGVFRAGDSLFVDDWGLGRATILSLDLKPVGKVAVRSGLRGVQPRARDAQGWLYLELGPLPGPDGSGNRDSAAVLRGSPDLSRIDTVARLAPPELALVTADAGPRYERRVLSGIDRWGVLSDGTVWVARVYQNRVDWIARTGTVSRGVPLPDRALTITQEDREVFLNRFPPELRGTAEKVPFALVKPPFEAARTAPDGKVWLEKSRAIGDSVRSYQVVDRTGRLSRILRHPGLGHVIAVSGGMALVAEPYEHGVRLLRYQIPP
jgi:hypothetical protein